MDVETTASAAKYWSAAVMGIGMTWAVAWVIVNLLKRNDIGPGDMPTEPEKCNLPTWENKTTTYSIDREELKRILREMELEKELEGFKTMNDDNPITQALRETAAEMAEEKRTRDKKLSEMTDEEYQQEMRENGPRGPSGPF